MLRPDTKLGLLAGKRPAQLLTKLREQTGLSFPQAGLGWAATIGVIGAFFSGFALLGFFNAYVLAFFGLCILLAALGPRVLDDRLATLGDLATAAGLRSLKQLAVDGVRIDSRTIWQSLLEITANQAAEGTVGPETRLYRQRKRANA